MGTGRALADVKDYFRYRSCFEVVKSEWICLAKQDWYILERFQREKEQSCFAQVHNLSV